MACINRIGTSTRRSDLSIHAIFFRPFYVGKPVIIIPFAISVLFFAMGKCVRRLGYSLTPVFANWARSPILKFILTAR